MEGIITMKTFLNEQVLESLLEGYKPRKCEGLTKEDKAVTEYLLKQVEEIEELQAAKEVEEVINNEIEEDMVANFIDDLNDFVKEETKKQRAKKNEKFEIPSYFIKAKEEPTIKDIEMDLDNDGRLLKKWMLRKIKKEQVFIKNEYMDYATKKSISKTKAEKLLKDITEKLGLTKYWVTNLSEKQYPALKRAYTNAVYYK